MNKKRLVKLLPWALLMMCVAGGVTREVGWHSRKTKIATFEQFVSEVSSASSVAEERAAVNRLAWWMYSEKILRTISAFDRATGEAIPLSDGAYVDNPNTVFVLGIDTSGDRRPDHFYQVVLKDNSHIGLLMGE